MKKSFNIRVPRQIGGDDHEDGNDKEAESAPVFVKRPANKSRKSSSLRTSLASSLGDDNSDGGSGVVTPRRSNLSKVAIQRNAERRFAVDLPSREEHQDDDERPSYSQSILNELRHSTPSTPVSHTGTIESAGTDSSALSKAVDVAAKFGTDHYLYEPASAIPTEAEIQEKKARRARLAQELESDFIALDDHDAEDGLDDNVTKDEHGRLILKPQVKYGESRLVRDDEDIFENFDEFTSDGKIMLGRNADADAQQQRRAQMASAIAEAEGASDEPNDSEDSEADMNANFAQAQAKSGNYATSEAQLSEPSRPGTPSVITPLPTLEGVISRLRARLQDMQLARANKAEELESLRAERHHIEAEEVRVQAALQETAAMYAEKRRIISAREQGADQEAQMNGNGISSLPVTVSDMMDIDSTSRSGLGSGLGLGAPVNDDADDLSDDYSDVESDDYSNSESDF